MRARTTAALAALAAAGALALAGCGTTFPLPTESRQRALPQDGSYQRVSDWTGSPDMADVVDLLLVPRGTLSQLYVVANHGGTGPASRGVVKEFNNKTQFDAAAVHSFDGAFSPIAVASSATSIYVLDQGDTCLARGNPLNGSCSDTTGGWKNALSHPEYFWYVRRYSLAGGPEVESFTDTSLAFVTGMTVDAAGGVFVAGSRIRVLPDGLEPRLKIRFLEYGVFRYVKGIRPDGLPDPNVPGGAWHRDTTFMVTQGTGTGSAVDPRGIHWGNALGAHLYVTDFGNNQVKKMTDAGISPGIFSIDGSSGDSLLVGPLDVMADERGFIYCVDAGNRRVLRFDDGGNYIQRVDIEGDALLRPTAVAADDSLCYVADPGAARIIRYKRRP